MSIQAVCPHCHAHYRSVPETFLGKATRCKRCQKVFTVTSLEPEQLESIRRMVPDKIGGLRMDVEIGSPPIAGTVMDTQTPQADRNSRHTAPQRTALESSGQEPPSGPGKAEGRYSRSTPVSGQLPSQTDYESRSYDGDGVQQAKQSTTAEWRAGDIILNMYRVTSILGEGAMGRVFLVRHLGWNLDLAVKTPKAEVLTLAGGAENFEKEAETWVNLGLHPHTVSCYYVRRLGGIPRVFAEYVAGGSLADAIQRRILYEGRPKDVLGRILDVSVQCAWGLHYANEQGIIHQDVKPANVMVAPGWTIKVTDFGLAHGKPVQGGLGDVGAGTVMVGKVGMTPAYASPEQVAGQKLTRRTDIWSFAVSLLEMFTGEVTWLSGSVAAAALESYLQSEPGNSAIPRMPGQLADLLRWCFQENAEDRPKTLLDVATELTKIFRSVSGQDYSRPAPTAGRTTADSLNNRGLSLIDLGRSEDALACFENALKVKPHHPEATYNHDVLRWRLNRIDDLNVLRDMEEVFRSHDDQEYVKVLISRIQLERRDAAKALAILKDIHVSPDHETMAAEILQQARDRLRAAGGLMKTFDGYKQEFNKAFFLNSHHVVSLWADESIRIWDLRTGRVERSISVTGRGMDRFFLSPDKNFLLATEAQSRFSLWDLRTGQVIITWQGQTEFNRQAVVITRDNRLAFTGEGDGSISLWDLRSGHKLKSLTGHAKPLRSLLLIDDEKTLISGSEDTTIRIWDVGSGQCNRVLEGHPFAPESLVVTRDGRQLVAGCTQIKVWDLQRGQCLKTYDPQIGPVVALFLSPDNRFIIAGIGGLLSKANVCRIMEKDTGHVLRTFRIGTFGIEAATLSPDGRMILATGYSPFNAHAPYSLFQLGLEMGPYQAPFVLSRIKTSEELLKEERVYHVELQIAAKSIQSGDPVTAATHIRKARSIKGFERRKEAVEFWQQLYQFLPRKTLKGGWEVATFKGHEKRVTAVRFTSDTTQAVSAGWDKTIRVWEVPSGRCLRTLTGHATELGISGLALGSDDRTLISCINGRETLLWDIERGLVRELEAVDSPTTPVISPDMAYWLSGSSRRGLNDKETSIYLNNLRSGKRIMSYAGHADNVNAISLSADGRFVLSGGGAFDKTVKIWDLEKKTVLRDFGRQATDLLDSVNAVCLGRQLKKALSGGDNGKIHVWDIVTSKCLFTLEGHRGEITSLRMTGDERFALSSSFDSTLKVWDLQTGECLRTFSGHVDGITDADISLDGRYIVSAGADGLVKLWLMDWMLLDDPSRSPGLADIRGLVEVFLAAHTPFQAELPEEYPSDSVFRHAFRRSGTPTWTEEDQIRLMHQVRCEGFAGLAPQPIREYLEKLAATWTEPPPFPIERKPRLVMQPDGSLEKLSAELFEPVPSPADSIEGDNPAYAAYSDMVSRADAALQNSDYVQALEAINAARALPDAKHRPQALDTLGKLYMHCPRRNWLSAWESTPLEPIYETFYSGQISADGSLAVTGSYPCTLRWWDLTSGRCIFTTKLVGEYVKSVIISPDNRYVYCCSKNQAEQWDMATHERIRIFEGHEGDIDQIALDESGLFLASASFDGLYLWRTDTASIIRKFPIGENPAKSVCFSRDGRFLFSGHGYLKETLLQWDLITGKRVWTVANPRSIEKLIVSPDNRYLFSATELPTIWDIARKKEFQVFELPHFQVTACTFTPCGQYILFNGFRFGDSKTTLYMYELKSGTLVWSFSGYPLSVTFLSFSRNARYLLLGCTMMGPGVFETTLKKWEWEWRVLPALPTEVQQDAIPFLDTFLTRQTPFAAELPASRSPSEQEIQRAFTRQGSPVWEKADLKTLQLKLAGAGFGACTLNILNDELKKRVATRENAPSGKAQAGQRIPDAKAPLRVDVEKTSGAWRVVSAEPVFGQFTHSPLITNRLSGAADGFRMRRADYPEINFRDIRLIAVYRAKSDERNTHVLLFTALVTRPFLVSGQAIQYGDFPGVKAMHSLDSLRNLLNFIHHHNSEIVIDKRTERFLSGEAPELVNAKDAEFAAGLGKLVDSLLPLLKAAPVEPPPVQPPPAQPPLVLPAEPAVTMPDYVAETCPACGSAKESDSECVACGFVYARAGEPLQQSDDNNALMQVFERYRSRLNGKNIFAHPHIPLQKLENAVGRYAAGARMENVLVLVDITIFGGAKDGLVLTDQTLYAHDVASEVFSFKINEIRDIRLEKAIINYKLFVNKKQVLNGVVWDVQPQLLPLIDMIKKMSRLH